jgi:hypothetical protein
MSVNDLQIHSDHTDDGPDIAFEFDEKPRKEVYIGRDNPKRFYISVSAAILALSLFFLAAFLISTVPMINRKKKNDYHNNKHIGKLWRKVIGPNYIKPKHPLFLLTFVLLVLSLILVSAIPRLGRKRARYIFMFLIFGGLWYVSWVWLAYQSLDFEDWGGNIQIFCWIYLFFFNGAFGTFIAALTSNRKPRWQVGLPLAWVLTVTEIIYFWFFVQGSSPPPPAIILRLLFQALVVSYMVLDLEFMFTHRYDFYYTNDWFLGCVHLLTDWTFRFWYNLFIKRKRTVVRRASKVDASGRVHPPDAEIVEATTPKVSTHSINTAADEIYTQ